MAEPALPDRRDTDSAPRHGAPGRQAAMANTCTASRPALPERSALSPTIAGDGPPRMVKQPTGSGGEPSSPNCRVSAGGKARQLIFQPSLPGLRCLHAGHVPKRCTPQPLSLFNTFAAFAPVDPVTGRRRMCRPNAYAASAGSARQAPLARWPLEPGMRVLLCPCDARALPRLARTKRRPASIRSRLIRLVQASFACAHSSAPPHTTRNPSGTDRLTRPAFQGLKPLPIPQNIHIYQFQVTICFF